MTDVPHFAYPFRFATPQAAVVEQDSLDEIADCVLAVLLCPQGFRVELPSFGIEDPTFTTQPVDVSGQAQIWEPRASILFDEQRDRYDELVDRVKLVVQLRSET